MREILFRIKDRIKGKWYYGFPRFIYDVRGTCVFNSVDGEYFNAFAETDTLGQFTGLCDKNGKKIFEGDIVAINKVVLGHFVIKYNVEQARFEKCIKGYAVSGFNYETMKAYEVIGNIYDNPELIGE